MSWLFSAKQPLNSMPMSDRARRRLPRVAYDFVDGGAEDEITLARNRSAFDDLALVPRVLAGVDEVSTEIELFGLRLPSPVLLAPAGVWLAGSGDADAAAARGAEAAGAISVQAWSPEVPEITGTRAERRWYQLYLSKDRDELAASVERAKTLGFSGLVLTADVPVPGKRERDERNNLTFPLRLSTPRMVLDLARHPRWTYRHMMAGRKQKPTPNKWTKSDVPARQTLGDSIRSSFNSEQTWDDLKWLREVWDRPLLLKGVLCAEDADLAVDAGCDGVIVSNHGGRQLDGTPASIEMLPEIVEAIGGRAEVLLDSGVRRGSDVVKALCLGATACLLGRPWVFAVAVDGEAGVTRLLSRINDEVANALHLLGIASITEVGKSSVRRRAGAEWLRVP